MNIRVGIIASFFALILVQGCIGKDDSAPSQQNVNGDVGTQEEGRIITTLNEIANAESRFSNTRDAASILRFYTEDYAEIKDGKLETVNDQKQFLAAVLKQINSDEPIGISSKVTNIRPSVAGKLGWTIYEYEYKIVRSGVLQHLSHGQCTAIFFKQVDSWLMRHKHCSRADPTPFFLTPR